MAMPPMMSEQNPAASTAPAPAPVRPPLMGAQNATPPVLPPALNPQGNRLDSLMAQAGAVTGRGEPTSMSEDPMDIAANMAPEELTSGVVSTVLTASNSPEEALAIIESAADEIRALVQQGSGQDAGRLEELLGGLPV